MNENKLESSNRKYKLINCAFPLTWGSYSKTTSTYDAKIFLTLPDDKINTLIDELIIRYNSRVKEEDAVDISEPIDVAKLISGAGDPDNIAKLLADHGLYSKEAYNDDTPLLEEDPPIPSDELKRNLDQSIRDNR